jgi:two-component system sensor histidine kinase YesM
VHSFFHTSLFELLCYNLFKGLLLKAVKVVKAAKKVVKEMKRIISEWSLKKKLIMVFILIILLPVAIMSIMLYFQSARIISKKVSDTYYLRLDFSVNYVDKLLKEMSFGILNLSIDKAFLSAMEARATFDSLYEFTSFRIINKATENLTNSNISVDSVYVCSTKNGWLVGTMVPKTLMGSEVESLPWFIDSQKTTNSNKWIKTKSIPYGFYTNEPKDILSYYVNVKNNNNDTIGIMSLNIKMEFVDEILRNILINEDRSNIAVIDDENNIIASSDFNLDINEIRNISAYIGKNPETKYYSTVINNENLLVTYYQSKYTLWNYIILTPTSKLIEDFSIIKNLAVILFTLITITSVLIAVRLSKYIHEPVNVLLNAMKPVNEGNFDKLIDKVRKDEFGDLYKGFNDMAQNLKVLMDKLYTQEIAKKDIQLRMMSSQINAHFLYNTLDVIHWIARVNKVEEISIITSALAKYYRISLSEGRDTIKISDVLELISNYLEIYRIKSDYGINMSIEVEERLLDYTVLKYIFQPLIENSIQHGIEKKKCKGFIQFKCTESNNELIFTISDNGAGIPPEKLIKLQKSLNENDFNEGDSFALKNISNQIRLFYGERYGIKIDSRFGEGTTVIINIPIITGDG